MSSPFVTKGVDGEAPRRELHDFMRDKLQFSLYIQALQIMQIMEDSDSKVTENDPDSHFQIGGIHGIPYSAWTGDSSADQLLPNAESGYCTHGNNLFPTWHRPYVALYEQTVQKHAKEIAQQYNSPQWTNAANTLRIPFWDWANPNTVIPPKEFVEDLKLKIMTPNGTKWVLNPLLAYKFKTPLEYDTWSRMRKKQHHKYTTTFRWISGVDGFKKAFDRKEARSIQQSVVALLNSDIDWNTFSNHSKSHDIVSSLEGIHDNIHSLVGGFMADPAIAGFDPIFFLHHCSVDRLLAMWQSLHPKIWVSPGTAGSGTNTIATGDPVDVHTSLTPFWKSKSALFDSTSVQEYRHFGYDYPDFLSKEIDRNDPESVKKGIHKRVSELYGMFDENIRKYLPQDNPRVVEAIRSKVPAHEVESTLDKLMMAFTTHIELTPAETEIFKPHRLDYFDWTARVRVKHYALGESFGVHLYLDPPSGGSSEDELYDSYVGAFRTFVNSKADSCENCQSQEDSIDQGVIYLNRAIAERSGVNSFTPEKLLPWLSTKLSWKVKKLDGEEVPLEQVPSLEVVLHHTPIALEAGGIRPSKGTVVGYPILNGGF